METVFAIDKPGLTLFPIEGSAPRQEGIRRILDPLPAQVRFANLQRDGFRCRYCGRPGDAPGVILDVDHVVPVVADGSTTEGNLLTACKGCSLGKGGRGVVLGRSLTLLELDCPPREGGQSHRSLSGRSTAALAPTGGSRIPVDASVSSGRLGPSPDPTADHGGIARRHGRSPSTPLATRT